jgi:hypothetical protein
MFAFVKNNKEKGKVVRVHAMKAHKKNRGKPQPIILDIRWRWVVNCRLDRLHPGKEHPYLLNRRLGGLQSRSGRFWKRNSIDLCRDLNRGPSNP